MRKTLLLLLMMPLLFGGCQKIKDSFNKRYVKYSVTNNSGSLMGGGVVATISYVNENGENEFDEVLPGFTWGWSSDEFHKGDWARVQATCNGKKGSLSLYVKCEDTDQKENNSVELNVRNIVEASMSLD